MTAGEIVYWMGSRWRQENYFRYGRLHLDLDSHDTYTASADDPTRMVPNPTNRHDHNSLKAAAARLEREEATATAALLAARTPAAGESEALITSADHNQITSKWRAADESAHCRDRTRPDAGQSDTRGTPSGQQVLALIHR